MNIAASSFEEAEWEALKHGERIKGLYPGCEVEITTLEDFNNPGNYVIDIDVKPSKRGTNPPLNP